MTSETLKAGVGRPVPSVPRQLLARVGLAALSCLAAMVLTSWSGSRLPLQQRLAELVLCVLIWEAAVPLCGMLVRHRRFPHGIGGPILRPAATVLVASLPAALGMAAIFRLVGEPMTTPLVAYGQALLLGLLLTFARLGLTRVRPAPIPAPEHAAAAAAATPGSLDQALLRRHAPRLAGRRLLALEAEDHYVRFHTDAGNALVLMRLRDAVAALGPGAGWQPHRSFWLATGTEARAQRNGQGWTLTLASGLVVPVSRANVARLREAGYPPEPAGRTAVTGSRSAPAAPDPPPAPPW